METTATKGRHANPLTLWVPVKQGVISQLLVRLLLFIVRKGGLNNGDPGHFLHFVRFAGIPNLSGKGNMGLLLITDFDKPMTPYLNYFYHYVPRLRLAFKSLYFVAQQVPARPETPAIFEQYLTAHNLTPADSVSFAYNASVAQVLAAFPPQPAGNSASALTLWIPVKQDSTSQEILSPLLGAQKNGSLVTDGANLIHYSRTVAIPNPKGGALGILIAVEFDGPSGAFLDYFYTRQDVQKLFAAMPGIALNPPPSHNNLDNFKQFVSNNTIKTTFLLYAYRASVAEIINRFPPTP